MKLVLAISIVVFACLVFSQDDEETKANKLGYDVITNLLRFSKNKDEVNVKNMYDDSFVSTICGETFNKEGQVHALLNTTMEWDIEFNVTEGVIDGDELRFHVISRTEHRDELDYMDYVVKKVDDEYKSIFSTNFTRCDLIKPDYQPVNTTDSQMDNEPVTTPDYQL